MKIIDNYLSQSDSDRISQYLTENSDHFPVYFRRDVSTPGSDDGMYFIHTFFNHEYGESQFLPIVIPLLNKLNAKTLLRVQYNLYPKTFFRHKHGWHTDFNIENKGLIYYLNTNNGRTDIRNVGRVKSVKNRALFFNPQDKHRSTTCTDKHFRANIIINYL